MRLIKFFFFFFFILGISSCEKEKPVIEPEIDSLKNGILVLNEGLFQLNNASLSWVNLSDLSVNSSFFQQKTGRNLGDTGNDLQRYGGKIYIIVNVSSTIEVLDAFTGKSIKQIDFKQAGQGKQPRFISFFGSKAFVTCFDGYVDVIDTASLTIENRIAVGRNPDQIIRSNQEIIVSNSGGLNAPMLDSTLSFINPVNYAETKINVGKNPGQLEIINNSLFVVVRGNYSTILPSLKKIDLASKQIVETYPIQVQLIEKFGDELLIVYLENQVQKLGIFDPESGNWLNSTFIDLSQIQTIYQMHFDEKSEKIYLMDAQGYTNTGKILEFSKTGNKIREFSVGLNPKAILVF
jgi:hypothetical protein